VTRVQLAWVLAIHASQISGRSWPRLLTRNLRADLGGRRLALRDRPRSWEVSERRLRTNGERGLTTCWVRLHDLRHACATFMLLTGASPRTVMETLGHSQLTLTMNTYAHVLPQVEPGIGSSRAGSVW
jgi:integrase